MESVIIVAPFTYDAELRRRAEEAADVVSEATGVLVVSDGASRLYISRVDGLRDDLEPERLEAVMKLIPDPIFYSIDFSDIALCRRVLESIANDPNLLVDNDHGVLLPGPEFLRVLRSQRDWDWRKDAL